MRTIEFNKIRNLSDIAREYGCSEPSLKRVRAADKITFYERYELPKKNSARTGEYRIVYEALDMTLNLLQKNIATSISDQTAFPDYVQGFVKGRSIASNASLHLAKDYILKTDIINFFETISFDQVVEAFIRLGCIPLVAEDFADLCTLNGFLPQGASTSPIISNLVCDEMDTQLSLLGDTAEATYSRYADDITFSGETLPDRKAIEAIFTSHGFCMHPEKFHVAKRGQAQYVTGLSVFDSELPRIPKKMKQFLRQELYYIKKYGESGHLKRRYGIIPCEVSLMKQGARITGWIDFMTSIEPVFGNKMKNEWIKILGGTSMLYVFRRKRKIEI